MRSALYQEFCNMLGTNRIQTTAYHPISNGIVERFHRHLKASIKAHENSAWSEELPVVLLGIRTAVKEDVNASCAELLYGTPLRLPSDMIENNITQASCTEPFVTNLVNNMRNTNPFASSPHCATIFYVHPSLISSSHVFVRIDRVQKPLSQPYASPYKVLSRKPEVFNIDLNEKPYTISIDCLKPAHLMPIKDEAPSVRSDLHQNSPEKSAVSRKQRTPHTITRSGEHVHFPEKLVTCVYI
ncbi:hypothetical protein JTE90_015457 [Oedothorax gibbosus]|uniref:Integrase catalytic domain-containing protein n=1 Tax=Oedothorax gibbosus TaxID=931172 RepID=A0AAV6UB36_9ARAC|nr:hypothetical protein JTE90_015457 [Oedothorax gibbosus]